MAIPMPLKGNGEMEYVTVQAGLPSQRDIENTASSVKRNSLAIFRDPTKWLFADGEAAPSISSAAAPPLAPAEAQPQQEVAAQSVVEAPVAAEPRGSGRLRACVLNFERRKGRRPTEHKDAPNATGQITVFNLQVVDTDSGKEQRSGAARRGGGPWGS